MMDEILERIQKIRKAVSEVDSRMSSEFKYRPVLRAMSELFIKIHQDVLEIMEDIANEVKARE